jgi:hypothetical protein
MDTPFDAEPESQPQQTSQKPAISTPEREPNGNRNDQDMEDLMEELFGMESPEKPAHTPSAAVATARSTVSPPANPNPTRAAIIKRNLAAALGTLDSLDDDDDDGDLERAMRRVRGDKDGGGGDMGDEDPKNGDGKKKIKVPKIRAKRPKLDADRYC